MKYKFIFILLFMIICYYSYAQNETQNLEGKVTFITSKNVYVKFDKTEMIKIGDTLNISDNKPCLLVTNKSSNSVVCTKLDECFIEKNTTVTHSLNQNNVTVLEEEKLGFVVEDINTSFNDSIQTIQKKPKELEYTEDINARLSVASYSFFSNIRDDNHRVVTRLTLNAYHINHSKFSLETYVNYRRNFTPADNNTVNDNPLRIYNLAAIYDVDSTLSISIGRRINFKISSLGAIDGLQAEKFFNKTYVGIIAGFRPDIFDFGINFDLLQYGAYVGQLTDSENFTSQTTMGLAEQKNKSELDRRFAYFQHSSTIFKKINLFSTAELDLYNKLNDSISSSPRLTNLYVSARYRFNRKINLALSYDSRKRIIYYATYENDIERLLDEDIARQGFRARVNVWLFKNVFSGFSYSKRIQSDNKNKSDNLYGYISYSKVPYIEGNLSVTYNRNSSNYLNTNSASIRYSRVLLDGRLNADIYYRFIDYEYTSTVPYFNQNYFGTYLSYYIDRSLVINLAGEYSIYDTENNFRLNARIIKRFYRQREK